MAFQWEEMELALASFNDFDILGRIVATSPNLEILRFFTPEQLIAQLKAWIPEVPEPYGRNDRIRILAGAFSLLESRPGSIEAVIRQADVRYPDLYITLKYDTIRNT